MLSSISTIVLYELTSIATCFVDFLSFLYDTIASVDYINMDDNILALDVGLSLSFVGYFISQQKSENVSFESLSKSLKQCLGNIVCKK